SQRIGSGRRKPRIVLTSGDDPRVLKAAKQALDGGEVSLSLLGKREKILAAARDLGMKNLDGIELIDPVTDKRAEIYAPVLYELRKRRGVSRTVANQVILNQD